MATDSAFDAPWGTALRLTTVLSGAVLAGIGVIGLTYNAGMGPVWVASMVALPLTIVAGAALFVIRGYEIGKDKLYVKRLAWKTELSLDGLQAVDVDPEAMKRSIRIFGNGGLFCFAGRFRNRKLGFYRAFATDPSLAVVLRYAGKVVVVTPDNPRRFAARLVAAKGLKSSR